MYKRPLFRGEGVSTHARPLGVAFRLTFIPCRGRCNTPWCSMLPRLAQNLVKWASYWVFVFIWAGVESNTVNIFTLGNKPLFTSNEAALVLGITNYFLNSCNNKMYGKEPRNNETSLYRTYCQSLDPSLYQGSTVISFVSSRMHSKYIIFNNDLAIIRLNFSKGVVTFVGDALQSKGPLTDSFIIIFIITIISLDITKRIYRLLHIVRRGDLETTRLIGEATSTSQYDKK